MTALDSPGRVAPTGPGAPSEGAAPQGGHRPDGPDRLERFARAVPAILAALALAAYVVTALLRFRSGAELEWMEGGMVEQVRRVLAGDALYGPPTLASTPYLYTPLFTWVGAAVSWVVGVGPEPLRAVSVVASLVAFAAAGRLVVAETGDRWAGWVTAGLVAAAYGMTGFFYDIARADSLQLALVLVALVMVRTARTPSGAAAAGVVMTLAVLAQQDALPVAAAAVVWLLVTDRRAAAAYASALGGSLLAAAAALQLTSGGWFRYYVWDVPRAHATVPDAYVGFWLRDLRPLWWSMAVVGLAVVAARRRTGRSGVHWAFVGPVVLALLAVGWAGRLHSGGWDNVLIPSVAGLAVLAGIGLAVARRLGSRPVLLVACALVAVQFVALAWWPPSQVPTAADQRSVEQAVDRLRSLPGPVYLPGHPWYLTRAGREASTQSAAIADVLRGPAGPPRRALRAELEASVREQRWGSVVVNSPAWLSYLPDDFERYYRRVGPLVDGPAIRPVTGWPTGPAEVWVRR